jgi:hypothetical protein
LNCPLELVLQLLQIRLVFVAPNHVEQVVQEQWSKAMMLTITATPNTHQSSTPPLLPSSPSLPSSVTFTLITITINRANGNQCVLMFFAVIIDGVWCHVKQCLWWW